MKTTVDEALPLLAQALAISPSDFQVHRELGKAYLQLNQLQKARAELGKAIELSQKTAPLQCWPRFRKQGLAEKAKQ